MKSASLFAASLLLAISVLLAQGVSASSTNSMPEGTLKLAPDKDGGGQSCGIPFNSGDYNLDNTAPYFCRRDRLNYFQVNNAPSATEFKLEDDFCDDTSSQWGFTLKTVKHPTTTVWIQIASLRSVNEGEIVVPGLILVSKYMKSGDQIDELSCVRIKRSELP